MLVELRANEHYTMCLGQYDNSEQVVYAKCGSPTEVQWQPLQKMSSLLAAASVILRKYAPEGMRNEYIKLMIAALWQHKINQEDCTKIIEAVATAAGDDVNERLARIANVYKRETSEEIQGLPTLAKQFNWNDDEVKDFKKILLAITGRNTLPVWTHEFVKRIAYMMKQKKYYDLEDKEMYDGEAIDVKYAKQFDGKYTPLKYWKLHKDSKVCVDFTYKPATKERFVHVEKKLMINVYEENDLQPDPKVDTDLYWALVKHVIPHDDCRKHFLDWNAWILQNKGKKIRHGIIFQSNEFLDFNNDQLVIRRHQNIPEPQQLKKLDEALRDSLEEKSIVDILVESEQWLDAHKLFKPVSGFESKLDNPRKRFISTLFCYGCNLGPTQTARSIKTLSRKQVAWLNLKYVTEEKLEKAIVKTVNAYNKFELPSFWGSGKSASADGTKWNVYEQNLLYTRLPSLCLVRNGC